MLEVKKRIHKPNKNQEEYISKIQDELKNSIKNLYISDKKNQKTIDKYAQLTTKIRNKYAKLQQECNQLKVELHKYEQMQSQKSFRKNYSRPIRKRKRYDLGTEEESDESDSYVTEIRICPRRQKERIFYEGKINGVQDYKPQSPSEEEQEDNDEIQQEKAVEKPKKFKKEITKSIKI